MLKEFREFAMRGNVMDLAIGVIIGAAFGAVVTSLVNDVIMPPIGLATGGMDFSKLAIQVAPERAGPDGQVLAPVVIAYGKLINAVISFLIVAAVAFFIAKGMNQARRKEAEAPPPAPPEDVALLREIRDLLAKQ